MEPLLQSYSMDKNSSSRSQAPVRAGRDDPRLLEAEIDLQSFQKSKQVEWVSALALDGPQSQEFALHEASTLPPTGSTVSASSADAFSGVRLA
jgi:hypothetical protein